MSESPARVQLLLNRSSAYVLASVLVSAITLLRNLYFMRRMSLTELGQVAMLQTIVVFVGFVQLGILNGGYRLYASSDAPTAKSINNNVLLFVAAIGCVAVPAAVLAISWSDARIPNMGNETLIGGLLVGIATLGGVWVNNTLLAKGKLATSGAINLAAASISLSVSLSADSLAIAFLALLIQPLAIVTFALAAHPPSRPQLSFDGALFASAFRIGIAPFCAGIATLINLQIDRWFILSELGSEAMGRYYLTIVYSTIFTLIPTTLMSLYYPRAINAFENQQRSIFAEVIRRHLILVAAYIVVAVTATALLLPITLQLGAPAFVGLHHLVFAALPGLCAAALFDNIALVLQSERNMAAVFAFSFLALIINTAGLAALSFAPSVSLEWCAVIKSTSYMLSLLIVAAYLYAGRLKSLPTPRMTRFR